MEVCDQAVQNLELVARIDENVGPAAARADRAVLSRCGFNRPAACRTDTDDASSMEEAEQPAAENGAGKTGNLNILLAEDNELNAEILTEILRMQDFEVTHVKNGREAVDAFQKSAVGGYDVILMDVQMPLMDGYEATRIIRRMKRADAGQVMIFACTANAFKEDQVRALESGMNDFLPKPIDVKLLLQKMRKIMR